MILDDWSSTDGPFVKVILVCDGEFLIWNELGLEGDDIIISKKPNKLTCRQTNVIPHFSKKKKNVIPHLLKDDGFNL